MTWLLILLGPFVVVGAQAVIAVASVPSSRPSRRRMPVLRVPSIRLEVSWS
ncbi:MAG: hypothetical protein ABW046_20765 [Actinoplanes sp.]